MGYIWHRYFLCCCWQFSICRIPVDDRRLSCCMSVDTAIISSSVGCKQVVDHSWIWLNIGSIGHWRWSLLMEFVVVLLLMLLLICIYSFWVCWFMGISPKWLVLLFNSCTIFVVRAGTLTFIHNVIVLLAYSYCCCLLSLIVGIRSIHPSGLRVINAWFIGLFKGPPG